MSTACVVKALAPKEPALGTKLRAAFDTGFNHGYRAAVFACFGGSGLSRPHFDTADEEAEFEFGFDEGFNSVDD